MTSLVVHSLCHYTTTTFPDASCNDLGTFSFLEKELMFVGTEHKLSSGMQYCSGSNDVRLVLLLEKPPFGTVKFLRAFLLRFSLPKGLEIPLLIFVGTMPQN